MASAGAVKISILKHFPACQIVGKREECDYQTPYTLFLGTLKKEKKEKKKEKDNQYKLKRPIKMQ